MQMPSCPEESERAPLVSPGGGVVASAGTCSICGAALTGRQRSACSAKCRAALSRRTRAEGQAERDRRMRELLEAALRVVGG